MRKIMCVIAALVVFAGAVDARKVKGTITCGEKFLEGVVVTDGKNFASTNFKGQYTLEVDDNAEYVYIVTPAGYVADWSSGVPAFYQPVSDQKKINFDLQKTAGGFDYNIIAVADPQFNTPEQFAMFAGKPLEDIAATAKSLTGVTVGLVLGDVSRDEAARLEDYKQAITRTGVPFYPVAGMGPENYAFFLGKDVVIVLDNIISDTWVKGLMSYVPADADIYIAHANCLLDLVRGRKVTFLSGHTHVNNNIRIERNIVEHNIAAICGSCWESEYCSDGTPAGYKVFTKFGGKLSWYYKPVGSGKNHIAGFVGLGQSELHPNSVVVNVWDWDPEWKVEWYEDGVNMGSMDQVMEKGSRHYFAATPSRYAQSVTVSVRSRFGQKWVQTVDLTKFVEEQRLCADVTYNNIRELAEKGANSVVLDLCVGMNGEVHVGNAEGPLLTELIDSTDAVLAKAGRSALRYNLQMHTVTGKEEGKTVPYYHRYADYVMDSLWTRFLGDRLLITGSDYRALNHLNSRYPEVDIAFKVEQGVEDIEKTMSRLKFTPKWISFHYTVFNEELLSTYRQKGYCVSVWGVPDEETKNRIKAIGPDAVILPFLCRNPL